MTPNAHVALFVASVVLVSFAQLLLKMSADRRYTNLWREYANWRVVLAYSIYLATTLMVIVALRRVELKSAPILQSLGYIIVLVLERMFLGRRLTRNKLVGVAFIVAGVVIFGLR